MTRSTTMIGLLLAGLFSLGTATAASGKLVIYTSQPNRDAQQTVDAFNAVHPNVEVEWIRDGTTKVMAKLRAEMAAGTPNPDVLLIADAVTMEGLKRDGRLMAYPDAPVGAYPAGLHDAAGHYFGTKLITTGIVYNTNAPMKPTSWRDLVKPEAKGLVAMPSPLYSGAALIHLATLTSDPAPRLAVLRSARGERGTRQGRQRRHPEGRGQRRKALRNGDRLPPDPQQGQGLARRVRGAGGRTQRHLRARRHSRHREEPGSRQGLCRLPVVEGRSGACLEPGLSCPRIRTSHRRRDFRRRGR